MVYFSGVMCAMLVGGSSALQLVAPHGGVAGSALASRPVGARTTTVRLAYNPQPSKARPKKQKAPKEKVKGPPSAESMGMPPAEVVFFEGPPSITETLIPGLSVFTVVGIIPFGASLARQAWTRYKFTNRRLEVKSGFQGNEVVQITWREVMDVKWLRRYGGAAGDIVLTLQGGSKLEMRAVPDFDRNLAFMMDCIGDDVKADSFYPDKPAEEYLAKVAAGELPPPTIEDVQAKAALEGTADSASE
jgi:hypothetical protein